MRLDRRAALNFYCEVYPSINLALLSMPQDAHSNQWNDAIRCNPEHDKYFKEDSLRPRRNSSPSVLSKQDVPKAGWLVRTTPVVELVLKLASIAAIGVAGYWAWYQFNLGGNDGWMINLDMTTEVLPYKDHDNLRLLVVHVKSKNPRASTIEFDPKDKDSYDLTVRELPDVSPGTEMDIEKGKLITKIDLMPKDTDGYIFLPNSEFDDMTSVVLPVNSVVSLSASLNRHDLDFVPVERIVQIKP